MFAPRCGWRPWVVQSQDTAPMTSRANRPPTSLRFGRCQRVGTSLDKSWSRATVIRSAAPKRIPALSFRRASSSSTLTSAQRLASESLAVSSTIIRVSIWPSVRSTTHRPELKRSREGVASPPHGRLLERHSAPRGRSVAMASVVIATSRNARGRERSDRRSSDESTLARTAALSALRACRAPRPHRRGRRSAAPSESPPARR